MLKPPLNRLVPVLMVVMLSILAVGSTLADHTSDPAVVTIAGSLQSELGCAGDWDPGCANSRLAYDPDDDVWQATFSVPPGAWEYKAALNDTWDENYGANAVANGANIALALGAATDVKFYYDHKSHWVTDNQSSRIVTAPGSFQSELGCSGDWDPGCLRSWLQDADGDGIYTFVTDVLPPGNYESKAAINESWSENYGAGGVPNGANIPFSIAVAGSTVTFSFDSTTNVLNIGVQAPGHFPDNNVEYDGLGHNSQDSLYRVPFGAITPGTELVLRFRTHHNDVTSVRARFWDNRAGVQFFEDLQLAASDVSCYDPAQPNETCDYWQMTYTPTSPTTLFYRFIIKDGSATAYYDDDYWRDGEWGEATPDQQDDGFVVTVYDQGFEPVDWLQDAVVYQIFPDRFRNGRSSNDADPSEPRYGWPEEPLDQIILKNWGELPEGYCRKYVNPAAPCEEFPRGRDYFGGDLRGVEQRLNYLQSLGVTAIWFNPIFEAASNHAYDTQDYYSVDHFFGSNAEFERFVRQAEKRGIRVILDGVFNHVSSDSPYFDRYGHFATVGACESVNSPYRHWFTFRSQAGGPCAGPDGDNTMTYDAWFGFDSLPVLDKYNPDVQALVYGSNNAVARYWLDKGAAGWRLDVMGDTSFPGYFWQEYRAAVKATDPDAVIIGELWKKFEVLPKVLGDEADTAMNYRFRNAILGFFGKVDDKGFFDDGQSDQPPSLFVRKLVSIREDYPDAAFYTLLNLMDSHDTKRILWSLTPGEDNREDKEFNAVNLAHGKQMLRLATVVQMTMPGAPTIYYGDEVGLNGDDDPDDRRTFPWDGVNKYGAGGDKALTDHYRKLSKLRAANSVFREGDLTFLLADDNTRSFAYLMRTPDAAAIVAVNRSDAVQTLAVDTDGRLPSEVKMKDALGTAGMVAAVDGVLTLELPPYSAAVLLPTGGQDLIAPAAPTNLTAVAGNGMVTLNWDGMADARDFQIWRSNLSRGGYERIATVNQTTSYVDNSVTNGKTVFYVITAVDAAGNVGPFSNEAAALPSLPIGWANLQWPPTLNTTISAYNRTDNVYGQVWIDGETNKPGPTPGLWAQLGFGPENSNPTTNAGWIWEDAAFNVDVGNNDEFVASLLPESVGVFDYVYRYSTNGGATWLYADLNGPIPPGGTPPNPGKLTVVGSGDVTPPADPTGLTVAGASPESINLAWDAHPNTDGDLAGFHVYRDGILLTTILDAGRTSYDDTSVDEDVSYEYYLVAFDSSFNFSDPSSTVSATAARRIVTVTFNVTVPNWTPLANMVYIAGTLQLLDPVGPEWNPGGQALTRIGPETWQVALTGREGTNIEYKYTLGSWDYVEKGSSCEELTNRTLTLFYGTNGNQLVNDTVANWRNVTPCDS